MNELIEKLKKAIESMWSIESIVGKSFTHDLCELSRIRGKIEGLQLALSYAEEAVPSEFNQGTYKGVIISDLTSEQLHEAYESASGIISNDIRNGVFNIKHHEYLNDICVALNKYNPGYFK